ncbi:flagellar basal body-associated protein FliL [Shewanella sp. NIFS-20-20]|uniref:flagellar basal body-associated protein FliL n=1 Tax=Shewanella sp. NIFS-20-20 TaxID=2853806 RepID=UPI001C47F727|nr:flagellar basal body-associated protein FliL [Shewanella sp. NIFS-20-20]MBV7316055.1 flagellar basal body-associated protein FliL [Shewanella sp. NIFS-20-20]
MKILIPLLCLLTSLIGTSAFAAEEQNDFSYYGFEPEIVTNYISKGKKLGFVRISVELMVKNPADLVAVEHHDPLLRSAIVEILGNQTEEKIKSLTGREEIRRECYDTVNQLLTKETGQAAVVNLLFTRYLYD